MGATCQSAWLLSARFMIIGYFDYAVVALLVYANVRYDRRSGQWAHGCLAGLAGALVFGFGLPWLSTRVELARIGPLEGAHDGSEFLYTLFRYPFYWALFAGQVAFVLFRTPATGQKGGQKSGSISSN